MDDYSQKKRTSEGTSDEEKKANTEEGNRNNGENVEIKIDTYKKNDVSLVINISRFHRNGNNISSNVYLFKFNFSCIHKPTTIQNDIFMHIYFYPSPQSRPT